jgi:hypothetical protein
METVEIFENGNGQAGQLQKNCRLSENAWGTFLESLNGFTEDAFSDERMEIPDQRENWAAESDKS